jgi:hypothetical protein
MDVEEGGGWRDMGWGVWNGGVEGIAKWSVTLLTDTGRYKKNSKSL